MNDDTTQFIETHTTNHGLARQTWLRTLHQIRTPPNHPTEE